jgi:hypothetical protein
VLPHYIRLLKAADAAYNANATATIGRDKGSVDLGGSSSSSDT